MNIKVQREKERSLPSKKKTQKKPRKITTTYLHNSGLYYLQRFTSSVENFRRVMRRKIIKSCSFHKDQDENGCFELLEETIQKFIELELLNDDIYTKGVVYSMRRAGKSAKAIEYKLKSKGISVSLTKKHIQNHQTEELTQDVNADLITAIISSRKKRIGPFRRTHLSNDPEEYAKQKTKELSFLARAGFSYHIAQKVLEMNLEEAEEILYQAL